MTTYIPAPAYAPAGTPDIDPVEALLYLCILICVLALLTVVAQWARRTWVARKQKDHR